MDVSEDDMCHIVEAIHHRGRKDCRATCSTDDDYESDDRTVIRRLELDVG